MKKLFISFKILLTLTCLYFALNKIDFQSIRELFYSKNGIMALLLGIVIAWLQITLSSLRFTALVKNSAYKLSAWESLKIAFIGCFFSQTAFSFVSGDAMRIWYLVRSDLKFKTATHLVILDRTLGFIGLTILFFMSLPFVFQISFIPNLKEMVIALIALGSLSFAVLVFALAHWQEKLKDTWIFDLWLLTKKALLQSYQGTSVIIALSLLVHCCNIFAIYLFLQCFQVPASFLVCSLIMIPTMLIMMLPISIGGWGLREGSLIIGFGFFGVPSEPVLAASILFGIALLLGALPGSFLFLFQRNRSLANAPG